jgi:hypothetical protein
MVLSSIAPGPAGRLKAQSTDSMLTFEGSLSRHAQSDTLVIAHADQLW